jgi:protein phosphatase 1G
MQGWRRRMEDSHISELNIAKNTHIFGVFDGHGGKEVAQFVKAHFVEELLKNKSFKEGKMKKALIETFLKIDEMCVEKDYMLELKQLHKKSKEEDEKVDKSNKQNDLYSQLFNKITNDENVALFTGCTATVCLIVGDKAYFANAGDSRIVIGKKGVAYAMTVDHKPDLDSEKNRIYQADGFVTEGRVKGNLNLSRSLGDLEYKQNKKLKPEEQMITAFPDVVEESLKDVDLIFLGCDGIWDCKSNQEAIDFVSQRLKKDPNQKLTKILEQLMDQIIAPDIFTGKKLNFIY